MKREPYVLEFEQFDLKLTIINRIRGNWKVLWRYILTVAISLLFVGMCGRPRTGPTRETPFQKLDVPLEGYLAAGLVCFWIMAYFLFKGPKDEYQTGWLALNKDVIQVELNTEKTRIAINELSDLKLDIVYGSKMELYENVLHWRLTATQNKSTSVYDLKIHQNDVDQLIEWRDNALEVIAKKKASKDLTNEA